MSGANTEDVITILENALADSMLNQVDFNSWMHRTRVLRFAVADALAALREQEAGVEPDWSEAPEWAQWWASTTYRSRWFENKPLLVRGGWMSSEPGETLAGEHVDLPLGIDWRTTLRARPAQTGGDDGRDANLEAVPDEGSRNAANARPALVESVEVAGERAAAPAGRGRGASLADAIAGLAPDLTPAEPMPPRHCNERSPQGYICTMPEGHKGQHLALATDGEFCDQWPRIEPAAEEPERDPSVEAFGKYNGGLFVDAEEALATIARLTAERDALRGFVADVAEGDCGYSMWNGEVGTCIGAYRVGPCDQCKARALLAALAQQTATDGGE